MRTGACSSSSNLLITLQRIYTHTNLYDCENVSIIEIMAGQVLARLEAHDNCPSDVEVVLHARYDAKEAKMMRGYYLASPSLRCIFWLQRVFVNKVTNAERAAMSEAHLGISPLLVCFISDDNIWS